MHFVRSDYIGRAVLVTDVKREDCARGLHPPYGVGDGVNPDL